MYECNPLPYFAFAIWLVARLTILDLYRDESHIAKAYFWGIHMVLSEQSMLMHFYAKHTNSSWRP